MPWDENTLKVVFCLYVYTVCYIGLCTEISLESLRETEIVNYSKNNSTKNDLFLYNKYIVL